MNKPDFLRAPRAGFQWQLRQDNAFSNPNCLANWHEVPSLADSPSPLGESFTDIYTRLTLNGWPMDIAWREALARVQWLENHEQREQETKQEEKST
jgi:hypothetical protein